MVSAATRERILDAAFDAVQDGRWGDTKMAGLASAAGVSRQTLYTEFRAKEDVFEGLVERGIVSYNETVDLVCLGHPGDPLGAVGDLATRTVSQARERSLLRAAVVGEESRLLLYATTRSRPMFAYAHGRLIDHFRSCLPDAPLDIVDDAAEIAVRMAFSYTARPGFDDEHDVARIVRTVARILDVPVPSEWIPADVAAAAESVDPGSPRYAD
jgi:AcrR family transcriptional regulator